MLGEETMKLHPGVCVTSFTCPSISWFMCYWAVQGEAAVLGKQQSSDVQHCSAAASVLSKYKKKDEPAYCLSLGETGV